MQIGSTLRQAVWLLCVCMALQGLGLAAQRSLRRAHYHVDTSITAGSHDHSHAGVKQHEHDPSDLTAVYADADEAHHALSHATTLRSVLELESLPTQASSMDDVPQAALWPSRVLIHVLSHITGPLDRPPRA